MKRIKRILVAVAHPDDEVLGCGGALARHVDEGSEVVLLVMTDGVSARGESSASSQTRSRELNDSCKVLGINSLIHENLPDNQLDSIPLLDLVKKISPVVDMVNPDIIYTHFLYDLNQDHVAVSRALRVATRPASFANIEAIFMMEVFSSSEWAFGETTPFNPNFFVPLRQAHMNMKIEALSKYVSELREAPHPRRIDHILNVARLRGSQVGHEFAESFMLMRGVAPF